MKTLNLTFMIVLISLFGCTTSEKYINWTDDRCVLFEDSFKSLKKKTSGNNSGGALFLALVGDYKNANIASNGGAVKWIEAFSGDSNKVYVAYNELGETVGYKDSSFHNLSVADVKRLGPVTNRLNNLAEITPEFQSKREMFMKYGIIQEFSAAPMPSNCFLPTNN